MKTLLFLIANVCFLFGYFAGKESVEPVVIGCPEETNNKLIASRVNENEAVCVYVEPWQIKGKTKRKSYAI